MRKIAVILSGSGVYDGSEIHEATLSLLAIAKNGANYEIFAPDILQHHVINHVTGEEMKESRNVLVESARIARGHIKALTDFSASDFDGLLLPGGFGAAKNLSDWAFNGHEMQVIEDLRKIILDMVKAGKPIGALCISPVILAKTLEGSKITIGSDPGDGNAVEKLGALHIKTIHEEIVIDDKYKIISSPCYMLDANILQIEAGADNVVKAMLKMMD